MPIKVTDASFQGDVLDAKKPVDHDALKAAGKTPETMTPAARATLAQAYERYLKQYPQPLEPAVEAR